MSCMGSFHWRWGGIRQDCNASYRLSYAMYTAHTYLHEDIIIVIIIIIYYIPNRPPKSKSFLNRDHFKRNVLFFSSKQQQKIPGDIFVSFQGGYINEFYVCQNIDPPKQPSTRRRLGGIVIPWFIHPAIVSSMALTLDLDDPR